VWVPHEPVGWLGSAFFISKYQHHNERKEYQMANPTFTINAATELLESDRRKIQKALRNVPPDAKVKGQQQWRLKTILDAMDRLPGAVKAARRSNGDGPLNLAEEIFLEAEAFTRASDALVALGKMPKRLRKAEAKNVTPKLEAFTRLCEEYGMTNHRHWVLQQMWGGLLFALDIELDPGCFPDDDESDDDD
jgi:hypothetical protein